MHLEQEEAAQGILELFDMCTEEWYSFGIPVDLWWTCFRRQSIIN